MVFKDRLGHLIDACMLVEVVLIIKAAKGIEKCFGEFILASYLVEVLPNSFHEFD